MAFSRLGFSVRTVFKALSFVLLEENKPSNLEIEVKRAPKSFKLELSEISLGRSLA